MRRRGQVLNYKLLNRKMIIQDLTLQSITFHFGNAFDRFIFCSSYEICVPKAFVRAKTVKYLYQPFRRGVNFECIASVFHNRNLFERSFCDALSKIQAWVTIPKACLMFAMVLGILVCIFSAETLWPPSMVL